MSIPANLKNILQLEISHPVDENLSSLIKESFQEQYVKPIKTWALVHNDHKRKQLTKLLKGDIVSKKFGNSGTLNRASLRTVKSNPEFVINAGTSSINFNKCFLPPSPRKKVFTSSYRSQIQEDCIFGSNKRKSFANETYESNSFIALKVRKLFRPNAAERIVTKAVENTEFINELLNWAENNAQAYPYDPHPSSPRLLPRNQAKLNHAIFAEDHMEKNTYAPTQPGKPRFNVPTNADSLQHTTYRDFYSIEARNGVEPSMVKPFLPVATTQPFSSMPDVKGTEFSYSREMIKDQVAKNRDAFKAYQNLSYAKTML